MNEDRREWVESAKLTARAMDNARESKIMREREISREGTKGKGERTEVGAAEVNLARKSCCVFQTSRSDIFFFSIL